MVTGAASGIGAAVCHRLHALGAHLIGVDINADGLALLKSNLGDRVVTFTLDVTDSTQVQSLTKHVEGLDYAVNSAGILQPPSTLEEISDDVFERVMNTNLKGVFFCMRLQAQVLRARGGGSIVNLSSVAGLKGAPFLSVYSAAKHGVCGLTRSAALEYAAHNVRINALCPGIVDTPMVATTNPEKLARLNKSHPMGRIATVNEVAGAVLWLLSDAASFTTGASLTVDGGFTA